MGVKVALDQLASRDPDLAGHLEQEVRDAAALAGEGPDGLMCSVLPSRPKSISLQLDLPGWTKVLSVALPPQPGAVRTAVEAALATRVRR